MIIRWNIIFRWNIEGIPSEYQIKCQNDNKENTESDVLFIFSFSKIHENCISQGYKLPKIHNKTLAYVDKKIHTL